MEYQIESDETIPGAILEATRLYDQCDSVAGQSLFEVVDPDALDALFEPVDNEAPRSLGHVSFVYKGCRVTVEHGEYLRIHAVQTCPGID